MACMLVTGGAGFIGSHLAERLAALGHDVRVLDNLSTGKRENLAGLGGRVALIEADIRDLGAVREAVRGVDVVFHQAALASVPRSVDDPATSDEVNVRGTLNVLIASRDAGVGRLVYASSSSIYGNSPELPKREGMTPAPESPYAAGKLAGEHYCRVFSLLYGLPCVALRYFNVFGPRQDPSSQYAAVVPLFASALLASEQPVIYGDGEQSRDFTYVANVVDANLAAAGSRDAVGQALNIACGSTTTVSDLCERLRLLCGADVRPRFARPRPGDVKHSWADVTRARSVLGFAPAVDLDEGLARTVEWFRAAGAGRRGA
ncbi:MAG: SDR family oxidoreductase [Candidatus Eisenbacteria bacterium]|nr:SDR family oxidoreductase [Candidatus Eisenbacteria bacterium]